MVFWNTDKFFIPDWENLFKSRDFVKVISEMHILREIRNISYQVLKKKLRNLPKMALLSLAF
jgi:hypothetical protein